MFADLVCPMMTHAKCCGEKDHREEHLLQRERRCESRPRVIRGLPPF